jgi:Uma2 family endonuclease
MNIQIRPTVTGQTEAVELKRRRWTSSELHQMVRAGIVQENDRLELIDGEVLAMSPKGTRHETVKNELTLHWARRLPSEVKFAEEPPLHVSPHNELYPDIILFPAIQRIGDVTPDSVLLLVEISDSTLSYDLKIKAPLYAGAGVRDYWVIDAATFATTVHRNPNGGTYRDVTRSGASAILQPLLVPSLALRLDDLGI